MDCVSVLLQRHWLTQPCTKRGVSSYSAASFLVFFYLTDYLSWVLDFCPISSVYTTLRAEKIVVTLRSDTCTAVAIACSQHVLAPLSILFLLLWCNNHMPTAIYVHCYVIGNGKVCLNCYLCY